jgi:hypothetical protein
LNGDSERSELFPQDKAGEETVPISTVIEIYKMTVEMADRVSQRRQAANSFYLSISTAFLSAFYLFRPSDLDVLSSILVSICGISLCLLWLRNIASYKDLNAGKFVVIHSLEERLGCAPYKAEWEYLQRGTTKSKHRPFTETERLVPLVFILIFAVIFLRAVPWKSVVDFFVNP